MGLFREDITGVKPLVCVHGTGDEGPALPSEPRALQWDCLETLQQACAGFVL